jgi:hypothetical protein
MIICDSNNILYSSSSDQARRKKKNHYRDLDVGGRILRRILKKQDGVIWTGFIAQERDQCWALVNTVMNFRVL